MSSVLISVLVSARADGIGQARITADTESIS